VVILDEGHRSTSRALESSLIEALEEKPSLIAENLRREHQGIAQ
jgi:hypothetical protein